MFTAYRLVQLGIRYTFYVQRNTLNLRISKLYYIVDYVFEFLFQEASLHEIYHLSTLGIGI